MTPAEVLDQARAAGVTLWAEGDALRYRGPREALTADFLDQIKVHKVELLAALAHPDLPAVSGEFIPRVDLPSDAEIKAGLRESLARIQAEEHNAAMADLARVHAIQEAPRAPPAVHLPRVRRPPEPRGPR